MSGACIHPSMPGGMSSGGGQLFLAGLMQDHTDTLLPGLTFLIATALDVQ